MAPRETADNVLAAAARSVGLDATDAARIRDGSNVMYQLPGHVVARIGPEHSHDNAARQVEIARWLTDSSLAVVKPLDEVPQPTRVGTRPVTWWHQLPEHRPATPGELGTVLRALHTLDPATPAAAPLRPRRRARRTYRRGRPPARRRPGLAGPTPPPNA